MNDSDTAQSQNENTPLSGLITVGFLFPVGSPPKKWAIDQEKFGDLEAIMEKYSRLY